MLKIQKLQKVPLHYVDVNIQDNKTAEYQIKRWVKELAMEFNNYERSELSLVLEFCEFNLRTAQGFLRSTSKAIVRKKIKEFCENDASQGETIQMVESKMMSASPTKVVENGEGEIQELVEDQEPGFPLFDKITPELLFYTFDFLDPLSLGKVACTCGFANKICKNPLLYRKFCLQLYNSKLRLPESSAFLESVTAVNNAGYGEFTHAFINKINTDVRSVVWLPDIKSYQISRNYYKQFKDFKGVYLNAARLSFIGVYMMKGKYLRDGEKDINGFYSPFHMVEYYRYLRFFPDGSASHCLTVKKLKKDVLERVFNINKSVEEAAGEIPFAKNSIKDNMSKGEYILQGDKLHLRLCGKKVVYEYELQVFLSEPGDFQLKLHSYGLRYIESDTLQNLPLDAQGSKTFRFIRIPAFIDDLEESSFKYTTT